MNPAAPHFAESLAVQSAALFWREEGAGKRQNAIADGVSLFAALSPSQRSETASWLFRLSCAITQADLQKELDDFGASIDYGITKPHTYLIEMLGRRLSESQRAEVLAEFRKSYPTAGGPSNSISNGGRDEN